MLNFRWVRINKNFPQTTLVLNTSLLQTTSENSKFWWSNFGGPSKVLRPHQIDLTKINRSKQTPTLLHVICLVNSLAQITTNNQLKHPEKKSQTCSFFFFQVCPLQHVGNFPKFSRLQRKTSNVGQRKTPQTREDQKGKFGYWIPVNDLLTYIDYIV